MDLQTIAISGVLVLGAIALIGAFKQMKPGFGPFNLRVLGIIIVAVFATTLGIIDNGKISSAIGILGAIAEPDRPRAQGGDAGLGCVSTRKVQ